ncbi:MAG: exonuclease domain-containing protein [Clostridium sp.]|nr:exonuclease domain-containing protein [Clostridium sp.]
MFISISIDENGHPVVKTSDEESRRTVREGKGKSLVKFPPDYTVIDIETTGLDPEYCDIIEIAAVRYSGGQKNAEFSSLVKPSDPVDDYITELTGITDEMLKDAPDPAAALRDFCNFVGSDLLIGYNVNFDINFLYDKIKLYLSDTFSNSFIDVMRIARRAVPGSKNYKLKTIADALKVPASGSHRATADCETCAAVFEALKIRIVADGGSLDDFSTRSPKHQLKASDIAANESAFDESHPLFGKICVFTGTLEKMQRRDAMQLVADLGGINADNVTKKTDFLILGNNDFCSSIKDGKSNKQKRAEELILKGADIKILSENVFYDLVLDE